MRPIALSARRIFLATAGLTLAFRLWLTALLPVTGDEAYFIEWGRLPDWGFYDHPPLIGWLLAALLQVSDATWWLRLPQTFQPLLLALAVRWAWPHIFPAIPQLLPRGSGGLRRASLENGKDLRDWAALLVLLAPVNVWNVLITTDTALVYCAVLSGLAWLKAVQDDDDLRWYAVAGLFLAGAVLSKYFAALVGFAYLVDVLLRRRPRAFAGLVLAYACTVPGLLLMAWWNSCHCWANYMFNFVNRHEANTGLGWKAPLLYAATLAYVLTPPALWLLFKRHSQAESVAADCRPASADRAAPDRSLAVLAIVPFVLFAGLSLVKTIGLHWVLSFVPFALLLALRCLSAAALPKFTAFFLCFAALHIAAVGIVARLPLESWRAFSFYEGAVLTFDAAALVARAAPGEALLASDGYSDAVTLGANLRRYVPVIGLASSHARHDDILTDWRAQDGRDIVVLLKKAPEPGAYERWFRSLSVDSFEQRGARFWVVRGRGFDYAAYRDTVLVEVRRRYYAIPAWLPQRACYFCDRYFPGETCIR